MVELFGLSVEPMWLWLALGLGLLLLELATGSLFLVWPAVAALIFAGVVAFGPELSLAIQLAGFAVLALVLTVLGRSYFAWRPANRASDRPQLNDRAAQLRGQVVTAIGAFENGQGAVRLDDGQWRARLVGDGTQAPADGDALTIEGVEGSTLLVARR